MTKLSWSALALALASGAFAALTVTSRYAPLVDLPQHASQIASWLRLDDARYPDGSLFDLNLGTPYLVAYGAARLLAPALGVVLALKVVGASGVVATAWAIRRLALLLGHSGWFGLLTLPSAVGYSYYFGFVSFVLATPLAVWAWCLALRYAQKPSREAGLGLALLLLVTFATHPLGFALALAGALPLLLEHGPWRAWPFKLWPVVPAGLIWLAWLPQLWRLGAAPGSEVWALGLVRVLSIPGLLVGMTPGDGANVLIGVGVLLVTLLLLGKPWLSLWRWLPLLAIVAGFLALPLQLRSVGFVYPRCVAFLVPAALLAFRPTSRPGLLRASGFAAAAVASSWLLLFSSRLAAFQRECLDFDRLVSELPGGLAMRPIVFEREAQAFPGVAAFLHFSAYYQVSKGGTQGFSFARYPTSVVRERLAQQHAMPDGVEWQPAAFDARRELPFFDAFVVRSERDREHELFGASPVAVELMSRHGTWWAYAKRGPSVASR